jgi:hypothetical protein
LLKIVVKGGVQDAIAAPAVFDRLVGHWRDLSGRRGCSGDHCADCVARVVMQKALPPA